MEPPATTARAGHQAGGRQAGPRLAQRRWASTCPAPAPSRGIRRAKTPGPAPACQPSRRCSLPNSGRAESSPPWFVRVK